MKKAGTLILIFIVLGGIAFFIIRQRKEATKNDTGASTPSLVTDNTTPDSWRTYENDLGYRIKMPPNILVNTDVGERSIHLIPDNESGKFGLANFIYVSVVSRDEIDEKSRVYNYNSEQFLELMEIDVGETQSLISKQKNVQGYDDWFTYERLADTNINGQEARVFINRKPWEFPLGVTELRYVIPTGDTLYILGAYFGGDISYASLTRRDVENILATFKIL